MSTWEFLIWWSLIVLTFLGSFLCSGLEIGSYSLNRVRLDLKASRPNAGEDVRILRRELEKPAREIAEEQGAVEHADLCIAENT